MAKPKIEQHKIEQEGHTAGINLSDEQKEANCRFLKTVGVTDHDMKFPCMTGSLFRQISYSHRITAKRQGDFIYLRGSCVNKQYPGSAGNTSTTRVLIFKGRVLCVMATGRDERGAWKTVTDGIVYDGDDENHVGNLDMRRRLNGYQPTMRAFDESAKEFDAIAMWFLRNPERGIVTATGICEDINAAMEPVGTKAQEKAKAAERERKASEPEPAPVKRGGPKHKGMSVEQIREVLKANPPKPHTPNLGEIVGPGVDARRLRGQLVTDIETSCTNLTVSFRVIGKNGKSVWVVLENHAAIVLGQLLMGQIEGVPVIEDGLHSATASVMKTVAQQKEQE